MSGTEHSSSKAIMSEMRPGNANRIETKTNLNTAGECFLISRGEGETTEVIFESSRSRRTQHAKPTVVEQTDTKVYAICPKIETACRETSPSMRPKQRTNISTVTSECFIPLLKIQFLK